MYKLFKSVRSNEVIGVLKIEGDVSLAIPMSEDNTDYQAYLKWVSEGNTPEPADV